MPFPVSSAYQNTRMLPTSSSTSSAHPHHKRGRRPPRGLWKSRVTVPPRLPPADSRTNNNHAVQSPPQSDTDDDDDATSSVNSKRHRRASSDSLTDDDHFFYWDYSRKCSPHSDRVSSWESSSKIMVTSTIAGPGPEAAAAKESCDLEDWEDLKELFARAAHQYENGDASEALPILRGVIHECHRFLTHYEDPSVLFLNTGHPPETHKPTTFLLASPPRERKCKCVELPTAFHVILGTVLFMFGNLIAQEPSLALDGEPDSPVPYWLATLDVFETGESLPSRTSGRNEFEAPEDWRMALVWGRTLVCIADETVTRARLANPNDGSAAIDFPVAEFSADDPDWPPESPFAAIAARRPPVTRRMSLSTASPNDLLALAMDQFSRGIFHMPHPQHHPLPPIPPQNQYPQFSCTTAPAAAAATATATATEAPAPAPAPLAPQETFSRAKELFTIASEVLLLAEKLPVPSERQTWAAWADAVFTQMKMEADVDAWRRPIQRARGRCWLVIGSARIDALEAALEAGEIDLGTSEEAREAREGLGRAVEFLERAKMGEEEEGRGGGEGEEEEERELRVLLAEALLTLGNLTPEEGKREELYARAQVEGGEDYLMGSEHGDDDEDDDAIMGDSRCL
ncbi:hypothetical protein D9615_006522 [Tricholomella constricta]|uniref:Uncharacterized protein n=1 Tax=Tricholomella constricta TaxID=117010 RepID=A0A8H5HA69_9AGAR|nr:hypothetical protein D9615_006522 [Tricholomella constricta]